MKIAFASAALASTALAALLFTAPAYAQSNKDLNSTDTQFLKKAPPGNMAEVEMGQLASKQAKNETVKEFGRWMASTHAFANRELTTLTKQFDNMTPSTKLDADAQASLDKLKGLHGDDFDRTYLGIMVDDHQKDIPDFEKEAKDGHNHLVKTFAQNILPALREHLKEAEDLRHDLYQVGPSGSGDAANAEVHGAAGNATP